MQMVSRLALFCERLIEAGWLAALIVAPLFFNIYSSRVFEPDKIALIRSLAVMMLAAWLIWRAERWRARSRKAVGETRVETFRRNVPTALRLRLVGWARRASAENPLTLPTLFLGGTLLISTLASVSPLVSIFGSYQRQQGLYTTLSYLVIFFLAAHLIRTRLQAERAITLALVVSFPIAFYGILQHYFLDPLPWVGDVTTRVASSMGNSIFIGAYLILVIPLTLARLIQTAGRVVDETGTRRARGLVYAGTLAAVIICAAAWSLSFDLDAKPLFETTGGLLTPEQLAASQRAFYRALAVALIVILAWWSAALLTRRRAANWLLVALYANLLAVQLVTLLFSQSRGPLLGLLGGLFTFGVLWSLVRGARKMALGAVGVALALGAFLILLNLPGSPLTPLRELPYIGRLGRVLELEGGTGRVRVLIWQGALQLILPHAPLWSPTTGEDRFNPLRTLIGYGPETMYVAYNKFYPPELAHLESRNATPDRSHNETFDALVMGGALGFAAENVVFVVIFYYALKWLGFISSARARNAFVALWFGSGLILVLLFGALLGWHFMGVALPAGMILGFFAYLILFTLRVGQPLPSGLTPFHVLWLTALVALFVAHFIEIHFGIAIVSTRTYFWFFAALFVALGARQIGAQGAWDATMAGTRSSTTASPTRPSTSNAPGTRLKNRRKGEPRGVSAGQAGRGPSTDVSPTHLYPPAASSKVISSAPLIALAFLVGLILAVMGFDFINTNHVAALESSTVYALDIVTSSLMIRVTTAGAQPAWAMLILFLATLLIGLGVSAAEWGHDVNLSWRDWGAALLFFIVSAFAVFSAFVFYHVLLIGTSGAAVLEALGVAIELFLVFIWLVSMATALVLLFDEALPRRWGTAPLCPYVARPTNWIVAPVLGLVAAVLILTTNIDPIRADIIYKQAVGLSPEQSETGIELLRRALNLQPAQDYYLLFLGRAYLDAAKITGNAEQRQLYLDSAERALHLARELNPLNTDHSANLARLAQARTALTEDTQRQVEYYQQATHYFEQAIRLSPNTAHLYDQYAQTLLGFAEVLTTRGDAVGAAQKRQQARAQIQRALETDDTFCLTYGVSALARAHWRERTQDALRALELAPRCGDVFEGEGRSLAVQALATAGDEAVHDGAAAEFESLLQQAAQRNPSLELLTTLANFYSKAGRIAEAIAAVDAALAQIPTTEEATRKRYEDFRLTLLDVKKAQDAVATAPADVDARRALARAWLARGQDDLALSEYQRILELEPNDYDAVRNLTLLLIALDRLPEADRMLTRTVEMAPEAEQALWADLSSVLDGIAANRLAEAKTRLEQLAQQADQQDLALVAALRALALKLRGTG